MSLNSPIKQLILASQSNPALHFKAVYDFLADRIFAYIKPRCRSHDDALDLTQEVFIDLHQALKDFNYRSDEEFYSFIYTIARRKLAKYYQKNVSDTLYLEQNELDELPGQIINLESDPDIVQALNRLDDLAREIIILHHWSRFTFPEIATQLNMTDGAVRVRHHRALKTLSTSLTNI